MCCLRLTLTLFFRHISTTAQEALAKNRKETSSSQSDIEETEDLTPSPKIQTDHSPASTSSNVLVIVTDSNTTEHNLEPPDKTEHYRRQYENTVLKESFESQDTHVTMVDVHTPLVSSRSNSDSSEQPDSSVQEHDSDTEPT